MVKLEEVVEVHAAMVRRIATVYERHPDRVDDLVQDVWIAVWQAPPRLNDRATLKSYIARITQNICVTHVRRALVRQTQPLSDTLPDPARPLDEATAHAMRLAQLIEAVRSLPENLKAVASLYLEDMPVRDIAIALGISESNTSVRLHRAKSAPKPDTQHLLQDLQRLNRLHQRLNRIVFAIMCGTSLLLIFEEATGRVTTHGTLSVIWILGLVLGIVWHRRARCNRSDAITLDTVNLLKFMIARAKRDLRIARWLYAGVPCGAVAGFLGVKLVGIGASPNAIAVPPHLHLIETGARVAALIAMMVTGAILARSRRLQVQELSEKLRLIKADL